PRISLAPPLIASSAAALAPSGVPLSSLTISCRLGLSRSNRASSPACLRLLPITPAWPCADSGTSSATLMGFFRAGADSDALAGLDGLARSGPPPVEQAASNNPHRSTPAVAPIGG